MKLINNFLCFRCFFLGCARLCWINHNSVSLNINRLKYCRRWWYDCYFYRVGSGVVINSFALVGKREQFNSIAVAAAEREHSHIRVGWWWQQSLLLGANRTAAWTANNALHDKTADGLNSRCWCCAIAAGGQIDNRITFIIVFYSFELQFEFAIAANTKHCLEYFATYFPRCYLLIFSCFFLCKFVVIN